MPDASDEATGYLQWCMDSYSWTPPTGKTPADRSTATMNQPDDRTASVTPARQAQPMIDPRTTIDDVTRSTIITARPVEGSTTEYTVAMGPFPARIRLDDTEGMVWVDVVVGEVTSSSSVLGRAEEIPYPRPQLKWRLRAPQLVTLRYGLHYASVTKDETIGVIAAGAMYAAALAEELDDVLTPNTLTQLSDAGYLPGSGFPFDPRSLLRSQTILPWPPEAGWES